MPKFDCAVWRPVRNHGGAMAAQQRGVLMHQQVGYGSLFAYFDNSANQVSSQWWVARDGRIEQYVDSAVTAWHAKHLNGEWSGIEFEGKPEDPITDAQIRGGAAILAEGARRHGWPLVEANSASERGFGFHRMAGGVATACPSDLRLSARAAMISLAGGAPSGRPPTSAPAPPPNAHSPGAAPAWPGRYLRVVVPLLAGDDVRTWQARMRERGWALVVDGLYGEQSARICHGFQSEKGLTVDGIVGPETWGAAWSSPIT